MQEVISANLGAKLAVLANLQGISQTQIAKESAISRISVNRFFRGRSEIRASDLLRVLEILGIDLNAEIEKKLSTKLNISHLPKMIDYSSELHFDGSAAPRVLPR